MNNLNDIKSIDIPIIVRLTDLYKLFQEIILAFPKTSRYSLGQKLLLNNLDILELIFLSTITTKYEKEGFLIRAQAKNELIKILIRISHQNDYIDQKKYLEIQSILNELGKMLSGWIKYIRNK